MLAYSLSFAETVPDSVRSCVREELTAASTLLRDDFEADPVTAVHEARKSLKKTRAVLRLVRPGLPKPAYRRENRALRDVARLVAGARDADVMVETVEKLAERHAGWMPASDFDDVLGHLRAASLAGRAGAAADGRAAAVAMLDAVSGRIDDWSLERCDWTTVASGMEHAYRAGRMAFAEADADPSIERLHDWRKRVKDIWYHQRLTCTAWPGVLGAQAAEAHTLSEILGDEHDLAVLTGLLHGGPGSLAGPVDPGPLLELIGERRVELLADARHLGSLVYAERPSAFARRIRRYLDSARAEFAAEAGDGARI